MVVVVGVVVIIFVDATEISNGDTTAAIVWFSLDELEDAVDNNGEGKIVRRRRRKKIVLYQSFMLYFFKSCQVRILPWLVFFCVFVIVCQ